MGRNTAGDAVAGPAGSRRGVGRALALTAASAIVWGVAHLRAGRRVTGALLMAGFAGLIGGLALSVTAFRPELAQVAVRPSWLEAITAGALVLAVVWAAVVIRSYQLVRPRGLPLPVRIATGTLVVALAAAVSTPLLWAARDTYTLRDMLGSIFPGDGVDPANPWRHRSRVNILLLGGDGAAGRSGIRTDSVTLASVDTRTGDTVLISLPRNLQRFPMPPDLRWRWPDGFTGMGAPGDEGLLNELYQDAEDHPELVPGRPKGRRGPELVKKVVANILGQRVDYYVLVNMFGFADIVDAVGGVRVNVTKPLPIGGDDGHPPTGWLQPGHRTLNGPQALWYGRSRRADDDYARMGRQKCLLKALAEQADPRRVLTRFQQIAAAAKKTISTDIPAGLLPALVRLSDRAKHGARMRSLMFVPPLIPTPYRPDVARIRRLTAEALAAPHRAGPSRHGAPVDGAPRPPADTSSPTVPADTTSLDELCR